MMDEVKLKIHEINLYDALGLRNAYPAIERCSSVGTLKDLKVSCDLPA